MFALEIVYLTTVANCVLLATTWPDSTGLIFALAALVVAACESAVGLGTLVVLYRFDKTIEYGGFETLRG
jgi:NADH:ubiquinone oxidoreductase subunit K